MSEDTPEKVENQPEEPAAKKKTARKRPKAAETKPVESEAAVQKKAVEPDTPAEEKSANQDSGSSLDTPSSEISRPQREEGETPTENPSVRRISSKRPSPQEPRDHSDEASDQVATISEPSGAEGQGKKRRRRRRKGSSSDVEETSVGNSGGGSPSSGADESRQPRPVSRVKIDHEKLEKKAWKIFLSEVSEEGLALVSDQDAKEIGRRSFRLAEIFLEEASKRHGG